MRPSLIITALLTLAAAAAPLGTLADGTTTLSGKAFVDYSYKDNSDEGKHVSDHGPGLDFKRFYFNVDHRFDESWAARLRTDLGDQNGKLDVFVKHAYVEYKTGPELVLRAGAADLPWVPYVEDLQGFRYVETPFLDRVKLASSADWGAHLGGKLGGGLVNYAVSLVNGAGYSKLTRSQSPTLEARIGVNPLKELSIAVGGEYGTLGQDTAGVYTPNTARRVSAMVAWVDGGLRVGAEGFYAKDRAANIVTGAKPEDTELGASGWLSFEFAPGWSGFGRVDYLKPNDDHSDLTDLYFNVGVEYKPVKALNLALVYKRDELSNTQNGVNSLSTANGTLTGSADAGGAYQKALYNEVGVFAQYVF